LEKLYFKLELDNLSEQYLLLLYGTQIAISVYFP
jgi:hypothetical protein